jgi:hypothetical protein
MYSRDWLKVFLLSKISNSANHWSKPLIRAPIYYIGLKQFAEEMPEIGV